MTQPLLIIGAGGFAREAVEAVLAANDAGSARPGGRADPAGAPWRLLGYLDDDPARAGTAVSGTPVLGPIDAVADYPEAQLVICIGRPDNYTARQRIATRLSAAGIGDERYATVIHPAATVGRTCSVGAGSVLLANVDLTADAVLGRHVAVMPQCVVTHDAVIEDYATLASGVRLGGSTRIGAGAYVGSGALLREGVTVGPRAMIGMGAVVTREVPAERLWFGAPARDHGPSPAAGVHR